MGAPTDRATRPSPFPARPTRFIGRAAAIDDLRRRLAQHRVITLIGTGGCGKTRLAVEVARRVEASFADGGAFVDLAPVEPALAAHAFAAPTGVAEEGGKPVRELLWARLASQSVLLLVDNCETAIDETAAIVDGIIGNCPDVTVMATSREPLGVDGELTWRVPSLTLPDTGVADPLAALASSEAGALLLDRASLARSDLAWTPDRAAAAVTICRRLDGVPLALELAASRLRALEPEAVARGLDDRFAMLRSGLRTAPPRQRTLEASIEWSHDHTPPASRVLLRRLATFAGRFTLDDAVAVAADHDLATGEVPALLADLVDRSLVQASDGDASSGSASSSYRLLESIRAYATARLDAAGESSELRRRHLCHFAEIAAAFDSVAETDELDQARDVIWRTLDDLRAAMTWGRQHGHADTALRIAADIRLFWITAARNQEGRDWLHTLLTVDGDIQPATRLSALLGAAQLALFAIDPWRQAELATEGLTLSRELGDPFAEVRALTLLGWAQAFFAPAAAGELLDEAISLAEQLDDTIRVEFASFGAGAAALAAGDLGRAQRHLERGVLLARRRDTFGQVFGLGMLGYVRCLQGDIDAALDDLRLACAFDGNGDTGTYRDMAEHWLAHALTVRGRYDEAAELLDTTLARARTAGNPPMFVLISAAWLAAARGDASTVKAHCDEALAMLEVVGIAFWEVQARRLLGDAFEQLGDDPTDTWQRAMACADAAGNPVARTMALIGLARAPGNDAARRRSLLRDAVRTALAAGYRLGLIDALEALAEAAADELGADDVARVLLATRRERQRIGYAPTSAGAAAPPDADDPDEPSGPSLTLEDAAAVACRGDRRPARPPTGWASLTPAEMRVVHLVAGGLTNPQIGERLFLSRRTVQSHLSHAFTKLGVTSRAELAAAYARQRQPA